MSEPATSAPLLQVPDAFEFLFNPPLGEVRYRVAFGGRGGTKSWSIARALLVHGMQQPLRILCAREYQTSIRESVHQLLQTQISTNELEGFYTVEQQRIYGGGTEFIFMGLHHDPVKIKSLEGIDICWVEEAHAITRESWDILVPTIRKENSEIWLSFNPGQPDDPIYEVMVIGPPPPRSIVRKVGWQDNPWLSHALREERESMLERDPEAEGHIWGGEPWQRSDSQIFNGHYRVAEFTAPEPITDESSGAITYPWGAPLYGADWGFAQDPTVLLRCHLADSRVWVDYDERGVGWNHDTTARRFARVSDADRHLILADSSRPETIREIQERGFRIQAAKKWPGSVEDGIEHLRSYREIVIHPRCAGFIQEARLYRYKVDKRTGAVLPAIVDAHNHGWDALRYALSRIIRKRRSIEVI